MKVDRKEVVMFTITDVPRLDPVRVVVENYELGRGRIIIQCYDRAWAGFWGAMGCPLARFFVGANWDYIADNLTCGLHGMRMDAKKRDEKYLRLIIETVQAALREQMGMPARAAISSSNGGEHADQA